MIVMDWLARMLALPSAYLSEGTGGGMVQGTTSEAVVAVMVAARERYLRRVIGDDDGDAGVVDSKGRVDAMAKRRWNFVAIGSEACHSSTQKAPLVTGVWYRKVFVRVEDGFSMRGAMLEETLSECRREGFERFYLTATLGGDLRC